MKVILDESHVNDTSKACFIVVIAVSMEHCSAWLFLADAYLILAVFC